MEVLHRDAKLNLGSGVACYRVPYWGTCSRRLDTAIFNWFAKRLLIQNNTRLIYEQKLVIDSACNPITIAITYWKHINALKYSCSTQFKSDIKNWFLRNMERYTVMQCNVMLHLLWAYGHKNETYARKWIYSSKIKAQLKKWYLGWHPKDGREVA